MKTESQNNISQGMNSDINEKQIEKMKHMSYQVIILFKQRDFIKYIARTASEMYVYIDKFKMIRMGR